MVFINPEFRLSSAVDWNFTSIKKWNVCVKCKVKDPRWWPICWCRIVPFHMIRRIEKFKTKRKKFKSWTWTIKIICFWVSYVHIMFCYGNWVSTRWLCVHALRRCLVWCSMNGSYDTRKDMQIQNKRFPFNENVNCVNECIRDDVSRSWRLLLRSNCIPLEF